MSICLGTPRCRPVSSICSTKIRRSPRASTTTISRTGIRSAACSSSGLRNPSDPIDYFQAGAVRRPDPAANWASFPRGWRPLFYTELRPLLGRQGRDLFGGKLAHGAHGAALRPDRRLGDDRRVEAGAGANPGGSAGLDGDLVFPIDVVTGAQ